MNDAVKVLLDKAAETNDAHTAMMFSQAALNAANAVARDVDNPSYPKEETTDDNV